MHPQNLGPGGLKTHKNRFCPGLAPDPTKLANTSPQTWWVGGLVPLPVPNNLTPSGLAPPRLVTFDYLPPPLVAQPLASY